MKIRNLVVLLLSVATIASAGTRNSVVSTYPLDKAVHVNTAMTIGIRFSLPITLPADYSEQIVVTGSKSGSHRGTVSLSDDRKTVIFKPYVPFSNAEVVMATFPAPQESCSATTLTFTISEPLRYSLSNLHSSDPVTELMLHGKNPSPKEQQVENFPVLSIVYNQDPAPGNLYMSNFRFDPIQLNVYRMILDNGGQVLSAEAAGPRYSLDFRPRMDGGYTYFDAATTQMYMLNSKLVKIDSLKAANGYETDGHEFVYTNTGGYIIMAIDPVTMDIRPYYEGGYPNASVLDIVIQEFDHSKNLLWEWRSLDHFKVSDGIGISLADSIIDYCHANAIDTDADGNLILSSRHMEEITKIDRKTGIIRWRWGGLNNEFTTIGDTIPFSYQHDIRRTPSGTFTLFDNGDYHERGGIFSRAVEYKLNEEAHTATKIWEYRHSPDVYGMALGSVQRLPNGNTLIGWGACDDVAITEVDTNNNRTFELTMDNQNYSYRVYKYTPEELGVPSSHTISSAGTELVCFPNPASENTTVCFPATQASAYTLTLWDQLGRCVRTSNGTTIPGKNTAALDLKNLVAGTYYVRAAIGAEAPRVEKIVIQ